MLVFQRVPSNFSAPNSWRAIQNTFHQGFVGVEYTQFRDGFNPTPFWSLGMISGEGIGLRENLQETPIFNGNHGFL